MFSEHRSMCLSVWALLLLLLLPAAFLGCPPVVLVVLSICTLVAPAITAFLNSH